MTRISCHQAVSLDGYSAGPDQSEDNPLGVGGIQLHGWHIGGDLHPVDAEQGEAILAGVGAHVMGRNMFGPIRGEWTGDWRGWWGDEPPYHAPVFVLTHFEREPLEMEGGTTFHFVTGGIEEAVTRAREAAGDRGVAIAGGASTVQQALRAGLLDDLHLHIAPVLLGGGERLLDGVGDVRFEQAGVAVSDGYTHVHLRVVR